MAAATDMATAFACRPHRAHLRARRPNCLKPCWRQASQQRPCSDTAAVIPPQRHVLQQRAGRARQAITLAVAAGAADAHATAPAQPDPAAPTGLWPALRLAAQVLRPDAWLLALTTVVLLATITTTLYFPLTIGALFDLVRDATAAHATSPLVGSGSPFAALAAAPPAFRHVLGGLVGCLVLSTAGNAAVAALSPLLAERFGSRLKERLMEALLTKPQSFFDATPKGDLVSRLSLDVSVLQATLSDYLGQRGFRSCFEVLGAVGLMAYRQPLMALVALVTTPALGALARSVVVASTAISYRRQAAAAEALDFASERLRHVQTVQVFDQQAREAASFAALNQMEYRLARKYAVFQGLVEGVGRLAVNSSTLALLAVGGWLVLQGRASVGTVLAAQVQCLFLSVGLSSVAASLGELGKAIGALERIAGLVEASGTDPSVPAEVAADATAAAEAAAESSSSEAVAAQGGQAEHADVVGRVEFRDVWFRYPGAPDWVLRGFNLTLEPGATVALVGASGGGKSTVASLLLGLYQPQRGAVLVDGCPLSDSTYLEHVVRPRMSAVLQQPMLMEGSVADVIRYGCPQASFEEVVAAARAASADAFIRELPGGYDSHVGERGHTLSGGQKQRLAIARALLTTPRILVLDEVTSALDVESEMAIDASLNLLPGCTKLMVAHRLSTVRNADAIAVVDTGRVVERGRHEELEGRVGGAYWRLLQSAELGADHWAQEPPSSQPPGQHHQLAAVRQV